MEGPLLESNPAAAAAGPEGPLPASLLLSPLLSPAVVAAPAEGGGGACASTSSSISCSTGPEEKRRRPSPRGIHERVESHDGPDASNGHNDNNAEIEEEQAPPQDDGPVFLQAIHPSTRAMAAAVIVDNDNKDDKDSALLRTSSSLLDDKRLSSADNDDSRAWDEGTMDQEELNAAVAWRQHLKSCLSRRDDDQARQLLRTYQRLVGAAGGGGSRGPAAIREVILLSGPSGSGKTRLARTLQGPVVTESNGYFLSGKFDKLNLESPAPYTAFGAAFGEFAAAVRSRGTDELQQVRRSIHAALGGEAAVLTRMIPGLEPLCGPCGEVSDPAVPTTKAQANKATAEAIQRFVFVFRTFLRAVATPQRPMVLLLDDIHFADHCSLGLLSRIVTDDRNTGLVVVCTVDDRPDSHPPYLAGRLRDIEDDGTAIQQIVVSNLTTAQVSQMLRRALDLPHAEEEDDAIGDGEVDVVDEPDMSISRRGGVHFLSRIVMQQTGGNPSDVIEFLCWLRESDLLSIDPDTGAWGWDVDEIDMTINTRQVGDFVTDKLEQLPPEVKDVLKVSACLGSHLNVQLLEYVLSTDVRPALRAAVSCGAIMYDRIRREHYFEHDGIQAAAYALIPEGDRELFHLEIGRRMWRRLDEPAVDRYLFTLLSQMNLGRRLITRERERVAVATLCLHAGIKAARSSTFRTAAVYLDFGLSLLDDSSWRQHYDLTLALHNAGAEMAMCTSNFERSNQLVESVLENAKIVSDKAQAYATRIYALGAMDRKKEAIEKGFEVLAALGEPMPANFGKRAVHMECCTVQKLLRGKSDEQLLRMPLMTNKDKQACLQILNLLFLSSLLGYPEYNPCITLRMVKLTMKYGASVFAASSFANYGMLLITVTHDIENAYRYGSLGEKFLDRFEAQEYMPRVRAAFYGCIYPFRKPVKDVICPLLEGYKVGVQTGDMEGAFLCMNLYFLNALEAGASITQIEREWTCFRESMVTSRHTAFLKVTILHLQTLHHLSGKSEDPLASRGEYLDFDEELARAIKDKNSMVYTALSISRMILAVHFNDLDLAVRHLGAMKHLKKMPPGIKKISAVFYTGLVLIACIRDGRKPRRNRRFAGWMIKIMDYVATQTPHNCLDKLFLLEAEYASAIGKNDVANKKYICAVGMAKDAGFPMYAALGYELWARHLYRVGDHAQSRAYFMESIRLNRDLGIFRKAERVESEMRRLFPDIGGSGSRSGCAVQGCEYASSSKHFCPQSTTTQPGSIESPSCCSS